jgi:methionyl-tRNA formyltransferase
MRIVFTGTGEIGVPSLERLMTLPSCTIVGVVTQPDRPSGRQLKLNASPVKLAALKLHVPIFQPENINAPVSLQQLKYLKPDVMVVCAYGQILSPAVLDLPKRGCLNIHASLLPKYRGASPIQSALLQGDSHTGITIMWMNAGLDTGDILLMEKLSIRDTDTASVLHDRLAQLAPDALEHALELIAKGKAGRTPQPSAGASVVKRIKKEQGRIDWSQPQRVIERHIRAMQDWPGAWSQLPTPEGPKQLKIFATIISNRAHGKPGEVLRVDKHGILVAAGEGGLLLREVQLEGKKRLQAAEFVNGFKIEPGVVLE